MGSRVKSRISRILIRRKMLPKLGLLKECLQDVIDHDDKEASMKILTKHHLEGEKSTNFFCLVLKKRKRTAQFDTLVKSVTDEEAILQKLLMTNKRILRTKYANSTRNYMLMKQ